MACEHSESPSEVNGPRVSSFIASEALGHQPYRAVGLYYPILDAFLMELKRRFTHRNISIMKTIQTCSPESAHFLEPDQLQPLAEHYNLDYETLKLEAILAKRTLMKTAMECTIVVLKELSPLKDAFPTLFRLIQTALTICVSTASCERTFSALKRIKTYLRSSMQEERLVDLAVLSVERGISQTLSLEDVVDNFYDQDKNRRILLS